MTYLLEASNREMARIIMVARPSELFEFIGHTLRKEGHRVDICNWRFPLTKINSLLPDLVIIHAGDSLSRAEELCSRVTRRYRATRSRGLILPPVVDGITHGNRAFSADTYLERPLHPLSLLARVRKILAETAVEREGHILVGDLVIDPLSSQVTRSGRVVPLTLPEFRLLWYFVSHPNTVCRRDELLKVVWMDPQITPNTVDVCVRCLRMKIEPDPERPNPIRSVRALGYRFENPEAEPSSGPTQADPSG